MTLHDGHHSMGHHAKMFYEMRWGCLIRKVYVDCWLLLHAECIEGYGLDSAAGQCTECPANTYKAGVGNTTCTNCTAGTSNPGSTSANDCIGEFKLSTCTFS